MFRGLILFFCVIHVQAQVMEELKVVLREVRVHVTDQDGRPIQGLQAADFSIEENGIAREIDFFREVNLTLELPVLY